VALQERGVKRGGRGAGRVASTGASGGGGLSGVRRSGAESGAGAARGAGMQGLLRMSVAFGAAGPRGRGALELYAIFDLDRYRQVLTGLNTSLDRSRQVSTGPRQVSTSTQHTMVALNPAISLVGRSGPTMQGRPAGGAGAQGQHKPAGRPANRHMTGRLPAYDWPQTPPVPVVVVGAVCAGVGRLNDFLARPRACTVDQRAAPMALSTLRRAGREKSRFGATHGHFAGGLAKCPDLAGGPFGQVPRPNHPPWIPPSAGPLGTITTTPECVQDYMIAWHARLGLCPCAMTRSWGPCGAPRRHMTQDTSTRDEMRPAFARARERPS
jgi:hypothetical protein